MHASAEASGALGIDGGTRVLGVIGWPVDQSLSPAIHNAAFRSLDMDRVYVPLPVEPGSLARAVDGLRSLGFEGANVTMPHKDEGADLADDLADDARRLHAVNTLVIGNGKIRGENTDGGGFARFLEADTAFETDGRDVLILGAGGAARAIALALARGGVARITTAVRDERKGRAFAEAVGGDGAEVDVVNWGDVETRSADLVVNATPIGADGRSLPPVPVLSPQVTAVDLLYAASPTPWMVAAEVAGARTFDGSGMLVHQAAASFELWTGVQAPIEVMADAFARARFARSATA